MSPCLRGEYSLRESDRGQELLERCLLLLDGVGGAEDFEEVDVWALLGLADDRALLVGSSQPGKIVNLPRAAADLRFRNILHVRAADRRQAHFAAPAVEVHFQCAEIIDAK